MAKNAVVVYGPHNVTDATAAGVLESAIEAVDYSATIKWIVVGPNTRGQFFVLSIDTA